MAPLDVFTLILLIFGFVCFVLAAIGVTAGRINLMALGLAAWILTVIINSKVFH